MNCKICQIQLSIAEAKTYNDRCEECYILKGNVNYYTSNGYATKEDADKMKALRDREGRRNYYDI